jgi:hypothetical protein
MNVSEELHTDEKATAQMLCGAHLEDIVLVQRAKGEIVHRRPKRWIAKRDDSASIYTVDELLAMGVDVQAGEMGLFDEVTPDPTSYVTIHEEVSYNVKTNAGIDFIHTQSYGTSPAANGLNYIALSNDTVTETASSTTLSTEIAANGLSRAQGTPSHTGSTTTTTIAKTFTASGSQSAQKAALFTASSAGTMNHVLSFTQRALVTGDQLAVTFTITIS